MRAILLVPCCSGCGERETYCVPAYRTGMLGRAEEWVLGYRDWNAIQGTLLRLRFSGVNEETEWNCDIRITLTSKAIHGR